MIIAFIIKNNKSIEIIDEDLIGGKENQLPESLIISPGIYSVGGRKLNISKEGLFRLVEIDKKITHQRIVYHSEISTLINSMLLLFVHGDYENEQSTKKIISQLHYKQIVCKCGAVARTVEKIIKHINGVACREGQLLKEPPFNSYSNGHTINEIKINNGNWEIYDFDLKVRLLNKKSKKGLSLLELLKGEEFIVQRIGRYSTSNIRRNIFSLSSKYDECFIENGGIEHSENDIVNKYKIFSKNGGIYNQNKWLFYGGGNVVTDYSKLYKPIDRNKFRSLFYT